MRVGNTKNISVEMLTLLNERYVIKQLDKYILIKYRGREQTNIKPIGEKFSLFVDGKRFVIQGLSTETWSEVKDKYTLFEVQAKYNELVLEKVEPTKEKIIKKLEKEN